jgi:ribonuclease P protein subunit POP4
VKGLITAKNIRMHELIGLDAEVLGSTDRSRIGMRGRVVDETKNALVIECAGKEALVPKKGAKFRFQFPGGHADVSGDEIGFRPEDRPKKLR